MLNDCKFCGKTPKRMTVMFMGYHVECVACGIAVPFPPVKNRDDAEKAWNEANDTRQTSQQKSSVGRETKHRHPITGE